MDIEKRGSWRHSTITEKTKGFIAGIHDKELEFNSVNLFAEEKKVIKKGVTLIIGTEEGSDLVNLPQEFSQPERVALLYQPVEYIHVSNSDATPFFGVIKSEYFQLKIKGGPKKGWEAVVDFSF